MPRTPSGTHPAVLSGSDTRWTRSFNEVFSISARKNVLWKKARQPHIIGASASSFSKFDFGHRYPADMALHSPLVEHIVRPAVDSPVTL
ncbi:hypothetical protein TRAPUB_11770 [Trametes pubescens]|uniref:Uncharacterized protein n=1 Tax=Trametes pubescens TaxID=154538 RepID=A0A1M2VVW8_TRAPU|nr:hypothetical protein TRAPUB_11770 [Trametes pubescens]